MRTKLRTVELEEKKREGRREEKSTKMWLSTRNCNLFYTEEMILLLIAAFVFIGRVRLRVSAQFCWWLFLFTRASRPNVKLLEILSYCLASSPPSFVGFGGCYRTRSTEEPLWFLYLDDKLDYPPFSASLRKPIVTAVLWQNDLL